MRKLMVFSTASLVCFSTFSMAEPGKEHCHLSKGRGFLPYLENPRDSEVDVKADDAQLVEDGTSVFTGNVEVTHSGQQLRSQRATYNKTTGNVTAQSDVSIRDSDIILEGDQAEWSLQHDKGTLIDADYQLREMHARGEASYVDHQGKTHTKLKNATYTTCAQGDDAWLLQAKNVVLDHVEAVGEAKKVVLQLAGVPFFYTPYISFPLNDERKSGFLTPTIGNSDETGFDVSTPYYWNIAPKMDATFIPRYMSGRGLMFRGEFRYLNERGTGVLGAGFLGSDDLENDDGDINPNHDEDRKYFSWKHKSSLGRRWSTAVDYNYVSDDEYLEDFGSNLSIASTTHINRDFRANYATENWRFLARAQGYQTLTDSTKPYQRLPQLKLTGELPDSAMGLTYGLETEYVDFDHDTKVAGQRFHIAPFVTLPVETTATFLTPKLVLQHTRYDLDDNVATGEDKTLTRTLPIASLDGGLFFERALNFANSGYLQTLEPRVFYLYIPHRDQDHIPDFDTSLNTFGMGQLFSYNRFSGVDRVGDANQLSLAVTTRFINQQTGRENLSFTLGHIRYFSDRKVTLPDGFIETNSNSDMVAELAANIDKNWTLRGEMQWDPHSDTSSLSSLNLRYRGDNGAIFNMGHRYRRDESGTDNGLEQVDISARVPFNNQWSVVGRWYRSIHDARTLEGLAGIEYESCCWSTHLVARNYINDVGDGGRNLAIFFQIELKGLGDFGQRTEELLARSILGYGS